MERRVPLRRRTPLAAHGKSDTAQLKEAIQAELRRIVIARDGGCVFRNVHLPFIPECNGYTKDRQLVLQADHLITRANSATYADPRLVICVCKGHHAWKSLGNKQEVEHYEFLARSMLTPERVKLWDACEEG